MDIRTINELKIHTFEENDYKDCFPNESILRSRLVNLNKVICEYLKRLGSDNTKINAFVKKQTNAVLRFVQELNSWRIRYKSMKEFTDLCKTDCSLLEDYCSAILDHISDFELDCGFIVRDSADYTCNLFNSEFRYLQKKVKFICLSEFGIECEFCRKDFVLGPYKNLFTELLRLIFILYRDQSDTVQIPTTTSRFLLSEILSYSHIYESLFPSGNDFKDQCLDTLGLLTDSTAQAQVVSGHSANEFLDILKDVEYDLRYSNHEYIKPLQKAIILANLSENYKFTDKDYYISMKASPSSIYYNGIKIPIKGSIFKSIFEVDLIKDISKEFDQFCGYKSPYADKEMLDLFNIQVESPYISTILIRNGGKFKDRAIHFGINSIQDRCNYIHNRLCNIHKHIPESVVFNQNKGVFFLQRITNLWKLNHDLERENFRIHCADFSNATDTLDQSCQQAVLEILLGGECARFFTKMAQLPKVFRILPEDLKRDSCNIEYIQLFGQPQGILGSFDAFHMVHYFIILCTLKKLGFTEINPGKLISVLGDDLVMRTPGEDPNDEFWTTYRDLALSCNFKINEDKSSHITEDSPSADLDFAKVQVRDGDIVSPIPYRLVSNSYKRDIMYSIAFYALNKRLDFGDTLFRIILSLDDNKEFSSFLLNAYEKGFLSFITGQIKDTKEYNTFDAITLFTINLSLIYSKIIPLLKDSKQQSTKLANFDALLLPKLRNTFEFLKFKEQFSEFLDALPLDHKINLVRMKNFDFQQLSNLLDINMIPGTDEYESVELLLKFFLFKKDGLSDDSEEFILDLLILYESLLTVKSREDLDKWASRFFAIFPISRMNEIFLPISNSHSITMDVKSPVTTQVCLEKASQVTLHTLIFKLGGLGFDQEIEKLFNNKTLQ